MNLYHGSIYNFNTIDLSQSKPYKDFGMGFYLTSRKDHAERIARQNKKIAEIKSDGKLKNIQAYRYNFVFDEKCLKSKKLNILQFKEANISWVKFIIDNRLNNRGHNYDIVVGPTADAYTINVINDNLEALIKSNYSDEIYKFAAKTPKL